MGPQLAELQVDLDLAPVELAVGLGTTQLEWLTNPDPEVLTFRSGDVTVIANTGAGTVPLPAGRVILDSGDAGDGLLPGDTTVWVIGE